MFEREGADASYRYAMVERHLLDLIESGSLMPGDRIPSLRTMSARMRMSVSTINQAYVELESQGVIESRPKSGFFVRSNFRRLPLPTTEQNVPLEPREVNRSGLIRTVKDLLGRKDFLPFAVACPDETLLPGKELAWIMTAVLREDPNRAMGYEPICGNLELRKQIAFRCADAGAVVMPEEIIVTSGAMEGISIAVRCLTRPGDLVLIQSPTFYCFLQLLDTLGLRVIEIPSHADGGISPADVANAVSQYDVKACILNLNFSNPDGSLAPEESKEEIVRLLAKRSIPLVEDDVSGDVHFGPNRPQVCRKYDRKGLVLLCSSYSKTISPGYRVGWLIPGAFFERALDFKVTTSLCTATPSQVAIAEFLRTGKYERHVKRLRGAVQKQMEAMQRCIGCHFPVGTKVTRPSGGMALWIELPREIDSREYFFRARAQNIGVVPGLIFSTLDKYSNFVRLTCSGVWTKEIQEGIEKLGALAEQMKR